MAIFNAFPDSFLQKEKKIKPKKEEKTIEEIWYDIFGTYLLDDKRIDEHSKAKLNKLNKTKKAK